MEVLAGPQMLGAMPLGRLLGRELELGEMRQLLTSARLVTITGVGGVGKTRLALELARGAAATFSDGVWVADLARLEHAELVPPTIAQLVGAAEDPGGDHLDRAARVLASGRKLLVLDNCEHLLAEVGRAVQVLLTRCAALRILATSREPLGLPEEQAWPVPPLALPQPGAVELSAVSPTAAPQLFCERVRQARPGFELTAENAGEVAAICRAVDGLPLALELAAAWAPVLSLDEIAVRLGDAMALPAHPRDSHEARHRTLRAALEGSRQLLEPAEDDAFLRLSLCVGGCDLDVARALLGGSERTDDTAVLDVVASLVSRSLLNADTRQARARYRMLEPVRQYAFSLLRQEPDREAQAREQLLDHLAGLAAQANDGLYDGPDKSWGRVLDAELPNIRSALEWGFIHRPQAAARLASSLLWYCYMRDLYDEGLAWAKQALISADEAVRTRALHMAGVLSRQRGDVAAADGFLVEAEARARVVGDAQLGAKVAFDRAIAAYHRGDLETARSLGAAAQAAARETGNEVVLAHATFIPAQLAYLEGDTASAQRLFTKMTEVFRRRGLAWIDCLYSASLAQVAVDVQDFEAALRALHVCFAVAANYGGSPSISAQVSENLGILAAQRGDAVAGLRLMAAASGLRERVSYRATPDETARRRRWIETARGRLPRADADEA